MLPEKWKNIGGLYILRPGSQQYILKDLITTDFELEKIFERESKHFYDKTGVYPQGLIFQKV